MEDENGYSLIRKVRAQEAEQAKKIPSVALTAFASQNRWFAIISREPYSNTLGLRLKLFLQVNFFNVDAERLAAAKSQSGGSRRSELFKTGYRQGRQGRKEKEEILNPSVLNHIRLQLARATKINLLI
ncbi:MAG: hypothetical protein V7L29_18915 [Nostoc sp.]|uniref:hypothetical protein n=1 Tax=Nostoc sp. TaxID=1180 RepID=UPI002FF448AD